MRARKPIQWPSGTSHRKLGSTKIAICGFLLFIAASNVASQPHTDNENICLSRGCIDTASYILTNMNSSADPCIDFYQFACSGFENTMIPEDRKMINFYFFAEKKLKKNLRAIIKSKIEPNEPRHIKLVKKFYKSCMNESAIETLGIEPLRKLMQKLGGWPVVDGKSWNKTQFHWIRSMYEFRKFGVDTNHFINFHVDIDENDSNKRTFVLKPPSTQFADGSQTPMISDLNFTEAYQTFMVDIAASFGANRTLAAKALKESIAFEMALTAISFPIEAITNEGETHNLMTIRELKNKYPSVPWNKYLGKISGSTVKVKDNEIVDVTTPHYYSQLEKLMVNASKTIQANYVFSKLAHGNLIYLNEYFRKKELAFFREITEDMAILPRRSSECKDLVIRHFPQIVNAMYMRKFLKDNETVYYVNEIVTDIKDEFVDRLNKAEWMDHTTKMRAINKTIAMIARIGYRKKLYRGKKFENYYGSLRFTEDNFFDNMLNLSLFELDAAATKYSERPMTKSDWIKFGEMPGIDGVYEPSANAFEIQAGLLQGILFGEDRPRYLNYGAIGGIIGHEIIHGFVGFGTHFNKNGKMRNWWKGTTENKFWKRTKCFIDKYGNYTIPEIGFKVDGGKTLGENIADNEGIKLAYRAYERRAEKMPEKQKLPGLEKFSANQMFWISFANSWCTKSRLNEVRGDLISDTHSPAKFRVIGTTSNIPEFARDFNCSRNSHSSFESASNSISEKKCSIW